MKNQYFQTRTFPKPIATFPELPGSARELPGAAEMLFGGLSSAQAPAPAESGRPQNWSPVIPGCPKPFKINEKTILFAQNPCKTSCNLPRARWKRHRAFWSRSKARWMTLQRAGSRARGVRPTSKLVPGDFQHRKLNEKSILSTQDCSKTFCNLPRSLWKRHRASWSRPSALWETLWRPGARARGDRPASKLVPGFFCVHLQ